MIESNLFKASPLILEKINRLCRLLLQEKEEFELVAGNVTDIALRRTILTLAQKNNQYASELSSQVQTLGGIQTFGEASPKENNTEPEAGTGIFQDEHEVLEFCNKNEIKMVGAYREILNESILYEGLRKMIRYQLNGILFAFMQLKLLNAVKLTY